MGIQETKATSPSDMKTFFHRIKLAYRCIFHYKHFFIVYLSDKEYFEAMNMDNFDVQIDHCGITKDESDGIIYSIAEKIDEDMNEFVLPAERMN